MEPGHQRKNGNGKTHPSSDSQWIKSQFSLKKWSLTSIYVGLCQQRDLEIMSLRMVRFWEWQENGVRVGGHLRRALSLDQNNVALCLTGL